MTTVDDVINIHVGWKVRFLDYFRRPDGSIRAEKVEDETACPLGRFLDETTDPMVREKPTFQKLVDHHRRFHQEAASIVRRAESGEEVRGDVALGADSEYSRVSNEIITLLLEMKREARGNC